MKNLDDDFYTAELDEEIAGTRVTKKGLN